MVAHNPRDTDATRLGERLQARRDIDTVTKDVVVLDDDVAQIDPDAEPNPALFGHLWLALGHTALDLRGATHGIHHTRKLGQEAVAGVLYDPASVLGDLRIDQFPEVGLEPFMRPFLVGAHQPRIRNYVCGEDRGETADRRHCRTAVDCLNQAYPEIGAGPSVQWAGRAQARLRRPGGSPNPGSGAAQSRRAHAGGSNRAQSSR